MRYLILLVWLCLPVAATGQEIRIVIPQEIKITVTVRVVTDAAPLPDPGPRPEPQPQPQSELERAVRTGVAKDAASKTQLSALLTLWRAAPTIAADPALATVGAAYDALRQRSAALLPGQQLLATRTAISEHLQKALPTAADAPLDAATRARVVAAFREVGEVLGRVAE